MVTAGHIEGSKTLAEDGDDLQISARREKGRKAPAHRPRFSRTSHTESVKMWFAVCSLLHSVCVWYLQVVWRTWNVAPQR